jgi:hypothetical protein
MPVLLQKIGRFFAFGFLVDLVGAFTLVLFLLALGKSDLSVALYVGFMIVPDLFLPGLFAILCFRVIRAKIKIPSRYGTFALRSTLLTVLLLLTLYVWAAMEIFFTGLVPLSLASLQTVFNDEFGVYLPVLFVWVIFIPFYDRMASRKERPKASDT